MDLHAMGFYSQATNIQFSVLKGVYTIMKGK